MVTVLCLTSILEPTFPKIAWITLVAEVYDLGKLCLV